MVHLSRKHLKTEKLDKLYSLFFGLLKRAKNEHEFLFIIRDLISPTEQIMLIKRIAIIYLLLKKIEQSVITDYLKVSKATVAKFKLLFEGKNDCKLTSAITSLLKQEQISHTIEDIFSDLFIQPGVKIGHWKLYWEHKRRKEKRKMID